MPLTPEEHNRTRGRALTILVMDTVRHLCATKGETSLWAVVGEVARRYNFRGQHRVNLYKRVARMLPELRDSGLVSTEKRWNKEKEVYNLIIRPCSAQ